MELVAAFAKQLTAREDAITEKEKELQLRERHITAREEALPVKEETVCSKTSDNIRTRSHALCKSDRQVMIASAVRKQLASSHIKRHGIVLESLHLDDKHPTPTKEDYFFKMGNFREYCRLSSTRVWRSKPFYTCCGGYKMCFDVDCLSSQGLLRLNLYLMRGEHDKNLQWPLRGIITVSVLNHVGDHNHHPYQFVYDSDTHLSISGRVTTGQLSDKLVSFSRKLTLDKMVCTATKSCQYLKDNSLVFCVSNINMDEYCHPQ